jgi:transposase
MVGVHQGSVHRWRKMARRKNGLAAKPHPGRKRRLSAADHRRLERLLAQGAKAHGWCNDLWTCPRVVELIRRHFGVEYHPDHVRKILVERLGWTSQKPERRARECDEAEIERWRREEFPRIKKRSA